MSEKNTNKFLEMLPTMDDSRLINIYKNCINAIAENKPNKEEAKNRLELIEKEWDRRLVLYEKKEYKRGYRPKVGMLAYLDYHVGEEGTKTTYRREILNRVFLGKLPFVQSKVYMKSWGESGSKERLRKLSYSLGYFIEGKKKGRGWAKDASYYEKAIIEWQEDLDYLKSTYYDGQFNFTWPDIYFKWND